EAATHLTPGTPGLRPGSVLPAAVERKLHQTIKKVTADTERLDYNTAISAMMEYLNTVREEGRDAKRDRAPGRHGRAVRSPPRRGAVVALRARALGLHGRLAGVRRTARRGGRRGSGGAGEWQGAGPGDGGPRCERGGGRRPGDAGRVRAKICRREAA